jgi:SAM-dependent methyltransferase
MIKYVLAGISLKAFSCCSPARALYRKIGNTLGQRKREGLDISTYVERSDVLVSLMEKYGVLRDGAAMLELGTGWMHWFSLYARLHANISVDLFDVWDNRQFGALRSAFSKLAEEWQSTNNKEPEVVGRLDRLLQAKSFNDLYDTFGLAYRIDDAGSLVVYKGASYDCVFSFHVLEHVPVGSIDDSISNIFRVLKPGGISIHQIGIDDHLRLYDTKESAKNYLRYSTKTWKRWFENGVQYHNRLQKADYEQKFRDAGFELLDEWAERCSIDGLPINNEWDRYTEDDLRTTILTLVLRKPGAYEAGL